jgi:hypothetical protein
MTGQRKTNQILKSLAGSALAGPGLFILFGHLVGAIDHLRGLLVNAAGQGLSLFSSVVLAATLDQHWVSQVVLGLLWPLLLIVGGAVLLNDESDDCAKEATRLSSAIPNPCRCASQGC